MDDFNNEREQMEAIKRWFARNGSALVTGIVLGLVVLFGWRYWQESSRQMEEAASLQFNRLGSAVSAGDNDAARSIARELLGSAPHTAYGAFAALALAGTEARAGHWDVAAGHLEWLIEQHPDDPLIALARTRLAAIYLQLGRPNDALAQVGPEVSLPNTVLTAQVRGEVHRALGRFEEARRYLEQAARMDPIAFAEENSPLGLGLDALGGPTEPEAAGGGELESKQAATDQLLRLLEAQVRKVPTPAAGANTSPDAGSPTAPPPAGAEAPPATGSPAAPPAAGTGSATATGAGTPTPENTP